MVKISPNCQKSAILYQKLSFGPLKTLFSLHEPIISLVSLQPQYKNGHFDIWNMLGSENFYYCHSRMVCQCSVRLKLWHQFAVKKQTKINLNPHSPYSPTFFIVSRSRAGKIWKLKTDCLPSTPHSFILHIAMCMNFWRQIIFSKSTKNWFEVFFKIFDLSYW